MRRRRRRWKRGVWWETSWAGVSSMSVGIWTPRLLTLYLWQSFSFPDIFTDPEFLSLKQVAVRSSYLLSFLSFVVWVYSVKWSTRSFGGWVFKNYVHKRDNLDHPLWFSNMFSPDPPQLRPGLSQVMRMGHRRLSFHHQVSLSLETIEVFSELVILGIILECSAMTWLTSSPACLAAVLLETLMRRTSVMCTSQSWFHSLMDRVCWSITLEFHVIDCCLFRG